MFHQLDETHPALVAVDPVTRVRRVGGIGPGVPVGIPDAGGLVPFIGGYGKIA